MLHVCLLSDINLESWLRRVVFLFHFHRLSVNCLLLFGRPCTFVTWANVHKGAMLSAKFLSQPVGTRHAARGGEGLRTGCAPRWPVSVEPLVHMAFADDSTVVDDSLVDCASSSHQLSFFLCQRLQCSAALLAAESARVLQAHPCTTEAIHRTTHSAAHEQHTHRLSASGTQN